MLNNLRIMIAFIKRDFIIYRSMATSLLINNSLISPILYTYAYGYLLPRLGISHVTDEKATIFFAGSILSTMFPLAFTWHKDLLRDLEKVRFINYQILVLSPYLVMFERILFGSWVIFVHVSLFFPLASLLLGSKLVLTHMSLWRVIACLYGGSFLCSAFVVFLMCYVQDFRSVRNFWLRVNHPMLQMGGLFVPWYVMNEVSTLIGLATLCNPMLYITEGLKQSFTADPRFFSFLFSISGMIIFIVVLYYSSLHFLRKKLDYI